jgi:outer membrane protein OmpA-like peptidoglycan-associated protein
LSRKQHAVQEGGPKVPGYIVTFSDMVTLLLTFFVMLLSLAGVQDPELFNVGRDSFLESIRFMGMGMFSGKRSKPKYGHRKVKYYIRVPDNWHEDRTIDAREEEIRRIFQQLSISARSMPSQIVASKSNFSVTNIRFGHGQASLDEQAKRFLTDFSADLQQGSDSKAAKLYVLGLAGDEATEKERCIVSARRAQAAAEFLQKSFGPESNWPVYSWGAGSGGAWVSRDSPISRQSQILVAVLRPGE